MSVCGSRYSDWLRAGRSGDRIPVGARFSAPVQTGPGANPASYTMGTGSFPGVKSGRGVTLTPHPLLVPWSRKCRAIPLLPLWAVRPVQSLSTCTRVDFTLPFTCLYVYLFVRPYSWNRSTPTGWIFVKFDVCVFVENLSRIFKFHCSLRGITGYYMRTHIW